jgi:heptosyltransferase-2
MDEEGFRCVLIGSAADRPVGDAIRQVLQAEGRQSVAQPFRAAGIGPAHALVDLIGRTDLPALGGILSRCRALVCNDSGAMHFASAIGVPVVAIFGATDEHATSPLGPHMLLTGDAWCRPCLRRECPIDHRCMTSISTDRVVHATVEFTRDGRP